MKQFNESICIETEVLAALPRAATATAKRCAGVGKFTGARKLRVFSILAATALALASWDSWGQAAAPTDPQIAAIVVTANQVDIDAGELARSQSKNKEVAAFASQMATDHSGVNKAATTLVTKLNVTPEDNATSASLKRGGDANLQHLKTLKGAAFDRAYIDNEVTYHQNVLDAIDHTLIPSAKNAELKALLVKVRPAFEAHLAHAKQIQSSMG
jgi:putative membrane protein